MKQLDERTRQMYEDCGISPQVLALGEEVLAELSPRFARIDEIAEYNQLKVLASMRKNRVSETHFAAATTTTAGIP